MFFPKLKTLRQTRVTLNGFLGLDRREKAPQGSFYDMENMGSDAAPALQVRPRRGTVAQLHYINAETERFNNAMALWNTLFLGYQNYYRRNGSGEGGATALKLC